MSLKDALIYLSANRIQYVRFEILDFYGISHCKIIPARHFEEKVKNGIPFYFGHLGMDAQGGIVAGTGYNEELNYDDAVYHADLSTLRKVPWATNTARVILYPKYRGELVPAYPRTVVERLLADLKKMGYSLFASHEHEFFVFDAKTRTPITEGVKIRSTLRIAKHESFVYQIGDQLPKMGVDIESLETEYAPGQYEIPYKPAFGIRAADNAFTFKNGIKEIAQQNGFFATFMTRPFEEHVGASAHLNHSLWNADGTKGVMHDPSSPNGLSKVAQQWMAGLLYHAPAITVLLSPTVNCFSRIRGHMFAPMNATWGPGNRTAYLRVKVNGERGTYVENRAGASGGCPYISLAAILAAGLDGLKNGYELPPPIDGIAYQECSLPPKTRKLPTDMESGLEELLNDKVICEALGDEFIKCFVALKTHEAKLEKEAINNGTTPEKWAVDYYADYI